MGNARRQQNTNLFTFKYIYLKKHGELMTLVAASI